MRSSFHRSRDGGRRLPIWLWVPAYAAVLGATCWLATSCSDSGVVRRSDGAAPPGASSWAPPPGATYVGADVCAGCHEKEAKSYQHSLMGKKADPGSPAAKQECETCHGPGSLHAEGGGGKGVGGLRTFGKDSPLSAQQKAAVCLDCHEKDRPTWANGRHSARGVVCMDCHSMHSSPDRAEHQLKEAFQPDVCAQCHKNVKADLAKQSHHPVREGKVVCCDCHNPHGTTADKNLRGETVNDLCYKCHNEKRGPFLWEHAPTPENCLTCHNPHGTIHDKLLNQQVPLLCQRCHSNSRHPGTAVTGFNLIEGASPSNRIFGQGCLNCHMNIHGSNHPSGKFFMR